MSKVDQDIDWSLTTWNGSRRAQLRRSLTLTLRERLEAAEGLADVARRFQEIRERGGFTQPLPAADGTRPEECSPDAGDQPVAGGADHMS